MNAPASQLSHPAGPLSSRFLSAKPSTACNPVVLRAVELAELVAR